VIIRVLKYLVLHFFTHADKSLFPSLSRYNLFLWDIALMSSLLTLIVTTAS